MQRRNASLVACLVVALSGAAGAQQAQRPDLAQRVITRLDEGQARLLAGELDWALRLFDEANDLTFGTAGLDPLILLRPNLYQARYYKEVGDWRNVEEFAGWVVSGLDVEATRAHPFRIEAQFLLALAMAFQQRFTEAEPLLRRVVELASTTPGMRRVTEEAVFALAETVSALGSEEAWELRDIAIGTWYEGHPVPLTKRNYLEFLQYEDARAAGLTADDLLPFVRDFIARIEAAPDTPESDYWTYSGFFGLLLTDAGEYAEAEPILEARLDYMRANGIRGTTLFHAIENLAAVRLGLYGPEAAMALFDTWMPQAEALGVPPQDIGLLTEVVGLYQQEFGRRDEAQASFRAAYLWLRQALPRSDENALRVAARIDPDDPALEAYSLRHEVAADRFPEFRLDARGTDVLRMVFEGGWRGVERHLQELRDAGRGTSVLFHVNEALFLALIGEYDGAMAALDTARETSATSLDFAVRPDAPIFDLVEAVARLWATGHEAAGARAPLDRLLDRPDHLTEGEWSATLALDAYLAFRMGDRDAVEEALYYWYDYYQPGYAVTPWDILAGLLAFETAFWGVGEEDALWLMQALEDDLAQFPTLGLARALLELSHYMGSETAFFADDAVIRIGAIAQQLATDLPPNHPATVAAEHLMATALSWRGRSDEALDWLIRAGDRLRGNPYRTPDELAGLLSEQANTLMFLDRYDTALVLAREAFETVDPHTGDPTVAAHVLDTLARALAFRQGDSAEAAALLARTLDDPAFFDRLPLAERIALLTTQAVVVAETGSIEEVRAVIRRAEALIGENIAGWETDLAELAWVRADAEAQGGDAAGAFAAMRLSNDFYFDWARAVLASGGGEAVVTLDTRDRAMREAALAWDYAKTLPE